MAGFPAAIAFSQRPPGLTNLEWDLTQTFDELRVASATNSEASLWIARRLFVGMGAGFDIEKSLRYYRQSADQGNAVAAFELGTIYREGKWIDESPEIAKSCFARAFRMLDSKEKRGVALQADELATLGWIHHDGLGGVKEDRLIAQAYLTKASDGGNLGAMSRIGDLVFIGKIGNAPLKDISLLARAASLGHYFSLLQMQVLLKTDNMSEDVGAKAKAAIESGIAVHRRKAESGNEASRYVLAELEFLGIGHGAKEGATSAMLRLADNGSSHAMFQMAGLLFLGQYVDRDLKSAESFARSAMEKGHPGARKLLDEIKLSQ